MTQKKKSAQKKTRRPSKNAAAKNEVFDPNTEPTLTPKQLEIAKQKDDIEQLVIKGFTIDQIAAALNISDKTVDRRIAERRAENLARWKDTKGQTRDERMAVMLAEYTLMKRTLWTAVSDATKQSDKISAVDKINDVDTKQIKVMQMLGYLPKDGALFDEARPMVVYFKNMPRPDRSEQLKKPTNEQSK